MSAVDELRRTDAAKLVTDASVATLRQRDAGTAATVSQLREARDLAKLVLKRSAAADDPAGVPAARAALAAAEEALEAAVIMAEGVADRLRAAELEAEMHERARSLAAADVARERNADVESRILALVPELKSLLAQHRGLARFARAQATSANGTITEPVPFGANNSIFGGTAFALKLARDFTPESDAARDVARVEVNFSIADLL